MCPNPQFPVALVTFTEEIINGKLRFLCSGVKIFQMTSSFSITCFLRFITMLIEKPKVMMKHLIEGGAYLKQYDILCRVSAAAKRHQQRCD